MKSRHSRIIKAFNKVDLVVRFGHLKKFNFDGNLEDIAPTADFIESDDK